MNGQQVRFLFLWARILASGDIGGDLALVCYSPLGRFLAQHVEREKMAANSNFVSILGRFFWGFSFGAATAGRP